tara:strand:+ start:940 stop:1098 length:159 start_codon:yes stop_codon:yes gene_type:complete
VTLAYVGDRLIGITTAEVSRQWSIDSLAEKVAGYAAVFTNGRYGARGGSTPD